MLKKIDEIYDTSFVEQIEQVKLPKKQRKLLQHYTAQVKDLNDMVRVMYDHPAGTQKEIVRKRNMIRKLFPPVDLGCIYPTYNAINAIRENLSKDKLPSKLTPLIMELSANGRGKRLDG